MMILTLLSAQNLMDSTELKFTERKKQLKVANVNVFYSEPNQWDFTECKPAQNDWSF